MITGKNSSWLWICKIIVREDGNEKIELSDDQDAWILNVDKSSLSFDGSQTKRGGRPTVTFLDNGLSAHELIVSKMSQSSTLLVALPLAK